MELLTLNENYQPEDLVENYSSLIWTERYSVSGDFELVSNDITGIIELLYLPEREVPLTLRDTDVVMIAEVFSIEKPMNEEPAIKVTGRTFETVLERRASIASLDATKPWSIPAVKASDAAYLAMRYVLGDPIDQSLIALAPIPPAIAPEDAIPDIRLIKPADYGYDPPSTVEVPMWGSGTTYAVDDIVQYDVIDTGVTSDPPVMNGAPRLWKALETSTPGVAPPDDSTKWFELRQSVTPGQLYDAVMEMLALNYHGLKSVRSLGDGTQVGLEIYNGTDRREEVVFDARFEQFDSATYYLTLQGSTNVGYILKGSESAVVRKDSNPITPSGLNRRVLYMDVSSENVGTEPDALRSRALVELYKYNATAIFDGEIAKSAADGFRKDYFLGDIVKLVGEYGGLSRSVRVVEFIRSQDATGESAYPAFEAIEELE